MSRPLPKRAGAAGCLLLALAPAPAPHAQPVGRLFSTPEQRAALDAMRDDPGFGREPAPAAAGLEPVADSGPQPMPEPAAPAVTINGIVLRGGVQRTSWINGVAVDAGAAAPGGIRIDAGRAPGGRFRVRLPDGRSTIDLKPGQKAGVVKGRVLEGYEHAPARDAADAAEDAAGSAAPIPSDAAVAAPATSSDGPPGPARPAALPAGFAGALLRQAGVVPAIPPAGMLPAPRQSRDE